jgi:hypothetical protein
LDCDRTRLDFSMNLTDFLGSDLSPDSGLDNTHYCVHFWHFKKMAIEIILSEHRLILSFKDHQLVKVCQSKHSLTQDSNLSQ